MDSGARSLPWPRQVDCRSSGDARLADGLATLGLDYRLARVVAGACEALYMYAAMRCLVFRDVQHPAPTQTRPEPDRLGPS
jgi:hypothetical protein